MKARALALTLTLVAALTALAIGVPSVAQAQAAQRAEPGAMMGERAWRRFEPINDMYAAGRFADAAAALEAYLAGELNPHERAMGEQLYGYALAALDRAAEAARRFERALELDALPNSAHFSLMRALAQVYAAEDQWQRAIDTLQEYLRFRPDATPEDQVLMAQAHAQLGRPRDALPWVRAALAAAPERAPESWRQLELALLFELEDFRGALAVLRVLTARWPDRLRYWEMMSGAHQALGEDREALAALLAAYHAGLLTEERKLLNLVRMSLYADLPYQAGRILADAVEAGRVEASPANLRLLLQAWTAAREVDAAVALTDRLAALTGEGELYVQLARLRMDQNEWQASLDAARRALELGRLANPGNAWLLAGIALLELERPGEAREAFREAQGFDEATRRQAREWQRFAEEQLQLAALRARP